MPQDKPLQGLRVVEMGTLLAGPFACSLMAQYGGEVIKIEPPGGGDPLRRWRHQHNSTSLWWYAQNRNKKSVTLDLRHPRGQELARQLIGQADILVENFRPGTLEKWGIGWEVVHRLNPRLVMVRVSGFGQTGPYRHRPGFGSIGEAMGGIRYVTGDPDRPPVRVGSPLGDTLAALFAFIGAMTAVYDRDVRGRGKGQVVDVALYEAVFAMTDSLLPEYHQLEVIRERSGPKLSGIAPSSTYQCKCGRYLVIGGNNDSIFKRLMRAVGRPELAEDPRFATNNTRVQNEAELDEILQSWSRTLTQEEALAALEAAEVPAGPIYSVADIARDPQYHERGMIETVEVPGLGPLQIPGIVPKFPAYNLSTEWPGPELGQHSIEVLTALGLSLHEIEALRAAGVTTWPEKAE